MEYSPISTDKMADADEPILNTSQQSNLASQLQPQDMSGSAQPFVDGEQILLGMNNYLRRSGRGEIKEPNK